MLVSRRACKARNDRTLQIGSLGAVLALEFKRDTMRSAVPCRISERRAVQSDFTPLGSSAVTRTIASCPL